MQIFLIIALVVLCLLSACLFRVICKLVAELDCSRELNDAVLREIDRAGWTEQYNAAFAEARLTEWSRQSIPAKERPPQQATN
jgi:hypothetical protein